MTRIVNAFLIDNEGRDQTAKLQQRVPITSVASKAGRFNRDHCADAPFADRRKQFLKAGPRNTRAGTAEIIIDDLDVGKAELAGTLGERILTTLTFTIVGNLISSRLADVDDGLAGQMVGCDLTH